MNTQNLEIKEIGTVKLTRRKNSKRISIRVKPDGRVYANSPWLTSKSSVIGFIMENTEWITKQQKKIGGRKTKFELNQVIKTQMQTIRIQPVPDGVIKSTIDYKEAVIYIPSTEDIYSNRVQNFIIEIITDIYRREAKLDLPFRVDQLAKKHHFTYQRVSIRNQKSRWGSCSSLGNINLNLQLMGLPNHLIDFIILHELSHTKEMNHGPNFWAILNKVCDGKAKELDKEMKSHTLIH